MLKLNIDVAKWIVFLKKQSQECKGSSICIHDKNKLECKGSSICIHNKIKYKCSEANCFFKKTISRM